MTVRVNGMVFQAVMSAATGPTPAPARKMDAASGMTTYGPPGMNIPTAAPMRMPVKPDSSPDPLGDDLLWQDDLRHTREHHSEHEHPRNGAQQQRTRNGAFTQPGEAILAENEEQCQADEPGKQVERHSAFSCSAAPIA